MAKDSRIRSIIHDKNTNAGGAMNDGIKAARGEYVCIVDNDDWLAENCIESLLLASNNNSFDVITCDWVRYISERDNTIVRNLIESCDKTEILSHSFKNGYRLLGALIRRILFVDNKLFFPENVFYEDNAIANCILCYANSIYVLHKPLYYYCYAPNSVTRSLSQQKIIDRIYTTKLFESNLIERGFVNMDVSSNLVNLRYLLLCNGTLLMLPSFSYFKVKKIVKQISEMISSKMPNEELLTIFPDIYRRLVHPQFYYFFKRFIYILKHPSSMSLR